MRSMLGRLCVIALCYVGVEMATDRELQAQSGTCSCEVWTSSWRFVLSNPYCGGEHIDLGSWTAFSDFDCASACESMAGGVSEQRCGMGTCDNPGGTLTPSQYGVEGHWAFSGTGNQGFWGRDYFYC